VYSDAPTLEYDMQHIRLAQWADCMLICPATANTIAKVAHGIADNLLTTLALSFVKNLIVAPAMNGATWVNPATQENVAVLKGRGVCVLPVGEGELACGESGMGRLIDEDRIVNAVLTYNIPRCLSGKKILIASGPTQEPLDPVRVITNRSSGKMGSALALGALTLGASVTVVSGPAPAALPAGATVFPVTTARQMQEALEANFDNCDICIMAAAVCDFRPRQASRKKISVDKKSSGFTLDFSPNPDIAQGLARRKKGQFLVCFALETENAETRARQKLKAKGCDMIIANTVSGALGTDAATVRIIAPGKKALDIGPADKQEVALKILLEISSAAWAGA
ncbi:MAG: bifunctional phosphopantothenoylcysteine decarboxylase/phosphopantothenate--cysteine ligase CoaBC, partial [Chitinivibrionales bacterium]|nr:bifunctional phosphopantothenoylcysteine decarboxylase/phosphopantothenate--cysteine ligase CoaBC [Chitinivibrionales bacterium]